MKHCIYLLICICCICILISGCNRLWAEETSIKKDSEKERLEISFKFHRGGIASSQYAIWIEDETGRLVRTLYATSFTVKGGYGYREDAIPVWVAKAKPKTMSYSEVDAVTGATPQNGSLVYVWDGTDENGNTVPVGKYRFFVEGTLYWKSRVIYFGELTWGGNDQLRIPVKKHLFNQSETNKNMITELRANYLTK